MTRPKLTLADLDRLEALRANWIDTRDGHWTPAACEAYDDYVRLRSEHEAELIALARQALTVPIMSISQVITEARAELENLPTHVKAQMARNRELRQLADGQVPCPQALTPRNAIVVEGIARFRDGVGFWINHVRFLSNDDSWRQELRGKRVRLTVTVIDEEEPR